MGQHLPSLDSTTTTRTTTILGPLGSSSVSSAATKATTTSSTNNPLLLHAVDTSDSVAAPTDVSSIASGGAVSLEDDENSPMSFWTFRGNYLLVTLVIMLADGLQGTHLYVLYEGYGYSVASLYCLGFLTGALTAPLSGPLVDRFGRKTAALVYCGLEVAINVLEQYPFLTGLIISRMVGGITTNLLHSVFEAWLDTEYRRRGFPPTHYEHVVRDAVVVSNVAAIASGYLAHVLADRYGAVGPFRGAVTCTALAFGVVAVVWTENYGTTPTTTPQGGAADQQEDADADADAAEETKAEQHHSAWYYLQQAGQCFLSDSKLLRVGIIQGLTMGSLQIFIFLWSPMLRIMAESATTSNWGLDKDGLPAYGLLFGGFMAAGVAGGICSPWIRRGVTSLLSPMVQQVTTAQHPPAISVPGESTPIRPLAVEFLAATCYAACSALLTVPIVVSSHGPPQNAFSCSVAAFLVLEFLIGVFMPCEGVIRSLYIPAQARASMMIVPTVVVNVAVAAGVVSTNFVSLQTAFGVISILMMISAGLQISLVTRREWLSLLGKVDRFQRRFSQHSFMKEKDE